MGVDNQTGSSRQTHKAYPALTALWNYVHSKWTGTKFGGIERNQWFPGSSKTSLHFDGRALDIMTNAKGNAAGRATGQQIANWAATYARELGVAEIVWWGMTWTPERPWWKPIRAGGGMHYDHVHIGIKSTHASRGSLDVAATMQARGIQSSNRPDDKAAGFAAQGARGDVAGPPTGTIGTLPSSKRQDAGGVERTKFDVPALSQAKIVQILHQVGFRGEDLARFSAIAFRESAGGGTWIVGRPDGGKSGEWSFGIFGLNTKGAMWDELKRLVPGLTDRNQLLDPVMNARVAFAMYKKYGDRPWGPYKGMSATYSTNYKAGGASPAHAAVAAATQQGLIGQPYTGWTYGAAAAGPPGVPATGAVAVADNRTIDEVIATSYGYLAAFLSNPEVGPILRQAAAEGWSAERLQGALFNTTWWKTTTPSAREWDAKFATDNAAAKDEIAKRSLEIQSMANAMGGGPIDPDRLYTIAAVSLRLNFSKEEMQRHVGAEVSKANTDSTDVGRDLRSLAAEYGVPMSTAVLQQWQYGILTGAQDVEQFQKYIVEQAKSLYPSIAGPLSQGVTVKQYAEPYINLAANTLGVAPESIDMADPKWNIALMSPAPDGSRVPMTLDAWTKYLKKTPSYGYQKTAGAKEGAYAFGDFLGKTFGKVAS